MEFATKNRFIILALAIVIFAVPSFARGKKDSDRATYATSEELSKQNSIPIEISIEPAEGHDAISLPEEQSTAEQPEAAQTVPLLSDISSLEIPLCPATRSPNENASGHEVHAYTGFELCYREEYEEAEWVSYLLTKEELTKVIDRTNDFRADTKISTGSATPQDYTNSGYDRGHLAPAADMEWSEKSVHDSFLMSNMTPQTPQFNRGIWKELEEQVRLWAKKFGSVYVVTGPVLEKNSESYAHIGLNEVTVPDFFYKVLLAQCSDEQHTIIGIGFIIPNQKCDGTLFDYVVSIDDIELRTGLDFFSLLPDNIEIPLEEKTDTTDWK